MSNMICTSSVIVMFFITSQRQLLKNIRFHVLLKRVHASTPSLCLILAYEVLILVVHMNMINIHMSFYIFIVSFQCLVHSPSVVFAA